MKDARRTATSKDSQPVSVPRGTSEYREGVASFSPRLSENRVCPYPIGDGRRVGWMTGWLDARSNHRLGHIFEKHGMEHP